MELQQFVKLIIEEISQSHTQLKELLMFNT